MHTSGIVSISFRSHSPDEILSAAAAVGLSHIEWGSDVHAPRDEHTRLQQLAAAALPCCSYGTYFRLGISPLEELADHIRAAKMLGTDKLRVWAGRRTASQYSPEERRAFWDQCTAAAAIAEAHGVTLCLECHRRSYTETKEGALELMEHVASPHFRMYWQPNPDISIGENLAYIRLLRDYITHVHVFHWVGDQRLPLREGIPIWRRYLDALGGSHHLLLEFMPDDRLESLKEEAEALHALIRLCP